MAEKSPQERLTWRQRLSRFITLNIRSKIVIPYLVLTLVIAAIGIYVVITLVTSSLDERLTNHLLEAGRVVSDSLVRHELTHLDSAQVVAYTRGFAEALDAGDSDRIAELAKPAAASQDVNGLIVIDAQGQERLHLLRQENGQFESLTGDSGAAGLWIVQSLLESDDPSAYPKRALGLHPVNQDYYYFTAVPVGLENRLVGVLVVATPLDNLLLDFKATSLADVIVYLDDGQTIATTFALDQDPVETDELLDELSISPAAFEKSLNSTEFTVGENIEIRGRGYRLARGPLQVGEQKLGVFGVSLPSHFIAQTGTTSRNRYTLLFVAATGCVIYIGYLISKRITTPIERLVRTSQAVAEGDLEQRTGIRSDDEIGTLAVTFDEMTGRLAERNRQLEALLAAYQEAAGRMRAILSSIADSVLLEDEDKGDFIPLNVSAETLLEELSANLMLDTLHELAAKEPEPEEEETSPSWPLELHRLEVGQKILSANSAAVRTDDDEHLGNVIVLRDVTAEAEAERLKDAFVAHVSHELRTPLTAIKGYISLLLSDAGGSIGAEQRQSFLGTVDSHVENLVGMINTLLDFSEMEARGRLGLQRQSIPLTHIVDDIAQHWRPQMDEKGLALHLERPPDLPQVNADPNRLRWAIMNLVRNAWQCTPEGGEVKLKLSKRNGRVVVDVIDNGVGIPAQEQEQLFSSFHRVSDRQDQNRPGLGLGLYVTKAIIEAHGGEIQVVSQENVGSTFSVVLPALEDAQKEKAAQSVPGE